MQLASRKVACETLVPDLTHARAYKYYLLRTTPPSSPTTSTDIHLKSPPKMANSSPAKRARSEDDAEKEDQRPTKRVRYVPRVA
jgi:hypothetical protein